MLDPMCGSGVVIRRALDCGHKGVGLDIDPLAVLMARVWTRKIPPHIQPELGLEIAERARTLLGSEINLPWIDEDRPTSEYINFWFHPVQREQIRALLAATNEVRGQLRDLAQLSLSRIIVTKSNGASLAADASHSRPHRVKSNNEFDVLKGFTTSFGRLLAILNDSPVRGRGRVLQGDARVLRGVDRDSVDAVITSPPYLNAIDYLRGHKLALVWLGYTISRIRDIKILGIGTHSQLKPKDKERLDWIVRHVSTGEFLPGTERVVQGYAHDIARCLRRVCRVLRPGGYAVYVVSNSILRGVEIDTAKAIIELASGAGLELESRYSREIPREHRYLPPPQVSSNNQLAARMRTESILRFRKRLQ